MEERQQQFIAGDNRRASDSGRNVACASLAGVVVGAPLLGMSGFTFLATMTLLLISSPLLLLFSPLLFSAALVLVGAMAGFGAAAAMALTGFSALVWLLREFRGSVGFGKGVGLGEKLVEFGEKMKEQGKEWAGYLQQKLQENSPHNLVHRG